MITLAQAAAMTGMARSSIGCGRAGDNPIVRIPRELLIEAMLTAGSYGAGRLFPSERGTPQGGVASPLLSNILRAICWPRASARVDAEPTFTS